MSEWKEVKLGDVCEIVGGGTPSTKKPEYWNGDISWISIEDIKNSLKHIFKTKKTITKLGLINSSTKILNKNDLIISARGTVGEIGVLGKEMAFNQSCYGLKPKKNVIYYDFLYYLLKNKVNILKKSTHGSVFDTITTNTLINFNISIPPLSIQKKIADILSVIDEKIETLQNINETLEEMAKAIFKSWFVDFDIVKAKTYGKSDREIAKEFGISEEIVKLFPSEFETSEIGEIPKGWEVKKLGDFFPVKTGKKNANIANNNGMYPFFTCSQEVLKTNSYSFDDSAILLAGNGDFNIKWYRGKFEAYQRTYVLIPYDKNNLGYLFFAMKHFLDLITGASQGSVIKFITKGMIENFKIVYPNNIKFINFFNQILDNIENNTNQIQTLQNLRDTLLPKLINGEIEVDELNIKGIENEFY